MSAIIEPPKLNVGRPNIFFHIGRPDLELPHKSMDRVNKFHNDNPDIKFVIVLWDENDIKEIEPKINKEKCEILYWRDNQAVMVFLMDRLQSCVGAQLLAPKWYICPDQHIMGSTGKELIEKCSECGKSTLLTHPFQDEMKQFIDIFLLILKLTNFDTSSGAYLHTVVNPTRNVMLNMPYALGLPGMPRLQCKDLIGSGKGMPAIICGAGPSLEDAIPDLKRLSGKVKILCVGRAYKMLMKAGIKVDYTISVEMFDWDSVIFDWLTKEDVGDTVMGYSPVSAPTTTMNWPGKSVCMWDMQTAEMLGRTDHILGGNSVSHHTLNFAAQILQCEPLILCGMDLGYSKPKTHAEGTTPEGWPEEQTKKDVEYQQELWVPCTGKGNYFHPDCHRVQTMLMGGKFLPGQIEVRSSFAYQNFATLFTVLIGRHGKKCYNSTPNGQKIEGTEYLDLTTYLSDQLSS